MSAWLSIVASRVRAIFASRRLDEDLDHEMALHLELLAKEHQGRGMSPEDARRTAALRFGGVAQLKEYHREHRGLPFLEVTVRDLAFALRTLSRHPTFALVTVATLAAGICAGTVVFSVANAVLLRPLPYRSPQELVRVFETNPAKRWTRNIASPANYADWKARNAVFTDLAAYEQFGGGGSGGSDVFLTGTGEPRALKALGVTGNLFTVLGTPPLLGRTLTDEETFEGSARVAVLSHALWQIAFAGDPAIVGKTIALSGRTYDVVGVMPRDFFFPGRDIQLWLPVAYAPSVFTASRRPHWLGVIGRRRSGVSLARAQQDMSQIARDLEKQYPDTNTEMGIRLEGFHGSLAFEPRPALLMLSGAVGLLFLIVCVNVASLQLGRGVGRARELAIRRALGAGRSQLVRQLLTEAIVLSVAGGLLGFTLAVAGNKTIAALAGGALPLFAKVRLDWTVILFAAGLSLAAPLVFGIIPALAASRSTGLTERTDTGSKSAAWWRGVLVGGEVALAIVLVVGAVLLTRSLLRLEKVDPGFNPDRALALSVPLPTARYADGEARLTAVEAIERRLRSLPGVQAVGATSMLALRGIGWTSDATVEGRDPSDYERELRHKSITPDYFRAMGTPLMAGRVFDDSDRHTQPPVTIVNRSLAERYFRGEAAVGRRIRFGRPTDTGAWVTIVGVVENEAQDGLDRQAEPEAYVPVTQQMQNPMTFVVRSGLAPEAMLPAIRRQVAEVDKDLALTEVTTLDALVHGSTLDHRFQTLLVLLFAVVALTLAALGIYGVLACFVSERSRELGIRVALGARPTHVVGLVVGQAARPVLAGAVLGIAAGVTLTGAIRSLLFGIESIDAVTYALALGLLAITALAACSVPAIRAARVDPLVALRNQ